MGLFSFLFGSKPAAAPAPEPKNERPESAGELVSFVASLASIPSIDFFGPYAESKSKEWLLAWHDGDREKGRGGHRESGLGTVVLINRKQNIIAYHGRMERPNHGHVSDNGRFSLEDWRFGSELNGTFYVFTPSGEQLIKREFSANLTDSGLSNNGKLAICQTANSPTEDACRLTGFDVEEGRELFSIAPQTGWAKRYEFNEEKGHFIVVESAGKFKYDRAGTFLDADKYQDALLATDEYSAVLHTANNLLADAAGDTGKIKQSLDAAQRVLPIIPSNDEGWTATAYKIIGTALEALGDTTGALAAYDKALALKPKIGVKRKADALRKALSRATD